MPLNERITHWLTPVVGLTVDYQHVRDCIAGHPERFASTRIGEGGVLEIEFEIERGVIRIEEPLGLMDDDAQVKYVEWAGIGSLDRIEWLEDFLECTKGSFVAVYATTNAALRIMHWRDGEEVRHSDLDMVAISATPTYLLRAIRASASQLPGWGMPIEERYARMMEARWH